MRIKVQDFIGLWKQVVEGEGLDVFFVDVFFAM